MPAKHVVLGMRIHRCPGDHEPVRIGDGVVVGEDVQITGGGIDATVFCGVGALPGLEQYFQWQQR